MEYPKRKHLRLEGYDYSTNGAYFITICTKDRKCILSDVGAGSPRPHLSDFGQLCDVWINRISIQYPCVYVDNYVVMPNHIHMIVRIDTDIGRGDPAPTISSVIGWLKYHITADVNRIRSQRKTPLFQRSFHDHIIRSYTDYREIWEYIDNNPLRWTEDKFYCK